MQVQHLNSNERAVGGFTHRFILTHEDLTETATATAQVITLLALVAGMLVKNVAVRVVTAFQDASDAAFNSTALTVGDDGSATQYLASQELNVNGTEVLYKAGASAAEAYAAANNLKATFNSMTGKSLSEIDAGEVYILAEIVDLRGGI